jgi:hypothetical protein
MTAVAHAIPTAMQDGSTTGLTAAELVRQLPPPITQPLDEQALLQRLLKPYRTALREMLEQGRRVYLHQRTSTWVDIGGWLGPRPLHVFAMDDGVFLVARGFAFDFEGDRPVQSHLPYSELRGSLYNHVTGRLILSPAAGARVTALKLHPLRAYQLLAQIHRGPQQD